MRANAIWLSIMVTAAIAVWYAPHWFGPVVVMWAWVFGTWWGYLTAMKERTC